MNNEMTLGKWLIVLLILMIPCVNIIMLFVWAFGSNDYPSRKTFAQAYLIYTLIVFVLSFALSAVFGASMTALMSEYMLMVL
ncbi:MAG: hypothetical protein IJP29_08165 [Lachnospiraceae bacterium]|nr:hypothetical protein [Lachnospiraceae bacterium]